MTFSGDRTRWQQAKLFWSAFASAFDMSGARAFGTPLTSPPRRHTDTSIVEEPPALRAGDASSMVPLSEEQAEQIIASIPQGAPRVNQHAAVSTALRAFAPNVTLSRGQVDALIEIAELSGKVERRVRAERTRRERLSRQPDVGLLAWRVAAFVAVSSVAGGLIYGIAIFAGDGTAWGVLAAATVLVSTIVSRLLTPTSHQVSVRWRGHPDRRSAVIKAVLRYFRSRDSESERSP